jgi:hypothetical protein
MTKSAPDAYLMNLSCPIWCFPPPFCCGRTGTATAFKCLVKSVNSEVQCVPFGDREIANPIMFRATRPNFYCTTKCYNCSFFIRDLAPTCLMW